jgi:hypothetical protein
VASLAPGPVPQSGCQTTSGFPPSMCRSISEPSTFTRYRGRVATTVKVRGTRGRSGDEHQR